MWKSGVDMLHDLAYLNDFGGHVNDRITKVYSNGRGTVKHKPENRPGVFLDPRTGEELKFDENPYDSDDDMIGGYPQKPAGRGRGHLIEFTGVTTTIGKQLRQANGIGYRNETIEKYFNKEDDEQISSSLSPPPQQVDNEIESTTSDDVIILCEEESKAETPPIPVISPKTVQNYRLKANRGHNAKNALITELLKMREDQDVLTCNVPQTEPAKMLSNCENERSDCALYIPPFRRGQLGQQKSNSAVVVDVNRNETKQEECCVSSRGSVKEFKEQLVRDFQNPNPTFTPSSIDNNDAKTLSLSSLESPKFNPKAVARIDLNEVCRRLEKCEAETPKKLTEEEQKYSELGELCKRMKNSKSPEGSSDFYGLTSKSSFFNLSSKRFNEMSYNSYLISCKREEFHINQEEFPELS